jgi:hypothetical protein
VHARSHVRRSNCPWRARYDDGLLGAEEDEITRFRDIWETRREIRSFSVMRRGDAKNAPSVNWITLDAGLIAYVNQPLASGGPRPTVATRDVLYG